MSEVDEGNGSIFGVIFLGMILPILLALLVNGPFPYFQTRPSGEPSLGS
jgi:hypothetical protein